MNINRKYIRRNDLMKMKLLRGYFRAKGLLEDFAKEERGGAEIIAIILIIVGIFTPYYGVGIRCMA